MGAYKTVQINAPTDTAIHEKIVGLAEVINSELLVWRQGSCLHLEAGKSLKKWKGEHCVGLERDFFKSENWSRHGPDLCLVVR